MIKPNFKVLGKKVGAMMKDVAAAINNFSQDDISKFEQDGKLDVIIITQPLTLQMEDVEILSEDIPGWEVAVDGKLTVALDITIDEKLREEGIAREFINRIQNLRKDKGFEVTDKIDVTVRGTAFIRNPILNNKEYICAEILAASLEMVDEMQPEDAVNIEVEEDIQTLVVIKKSTAISVK